MPLKSDDISELRWEWMRKVIQNPERVRNSQKVLERHFEGDKIIEFYRNLYDKPKFSQRDLDKLLGEGRLSKATTHTADAAVAATLS